MGTPVESIEQGALLGDKTVRSQVAITELVSEPFAPAQSLAPVIPILQPAPVAVKPLPPLAVVLVERLFNSRKDPEHGKEWQIELTPADLP
jgi:hypothetical protein